MPTLSIEPICAADLPAVLEMAHALAAHHGDTAQLTLKTLARDTIGPHPWLHVLVAFYNGRPCGYAALCPMAQLQFGTRGMDMHHLFVEGDMRGQGVGRALIKASLATVHALGCAFMIVGTHPDNHAAADVYLASGFERAPPGGPRFRIRVGS